MNIINYHALDIGQPSLTDPIRRLLENEEAVEKAEAVVRKIFIEKWIPQVKVWDRNRNYSLKHL